MKKLYLEPDLYLDFYDDVVLYSGDFDDGLWTKNY